MRKLAAVLVLSSSSFALAAGTQTATISSTTFTDLGVAPVSVQTLSQPVNVCVADSAPTAGTKCGTLQPGPAATIPAADAGSHVWASVLGSASLIAYSPVYGALGSVSVSQIAVGAALDGWNVTAGAKADAASTATDTTPITQMSVEKQISKSAQATVTTLGSPFQAGGSIGNTAFGATQSGTWAVTPTVTAASTMTLTSTTSAYTAGQLIANNGTAANITNPSFSMPAAGGAIPRLRIYTDDTLSTAWAGASVQVDLWDASPTWTNGDHAAWLPATGTGHHLASYSCTFPSAVWGDGLETNCSINVGNYLSTVATTVYWSLQATSGSGVLTASKHINLKAELN